jgi:glycosyltransferase involved in cell wall biosynthesis
MKVLISCWSMSYLSGSALYNYELALELRRLGHEVELMANLQQPRGNEGHLLKDNLVRAGVRLVHRGDDGTFEAPTSPDVLFASEPISAGLIGTLPSKVRKINIIHSEYLCEAPVIAGPDHYVAVRPSIKEKLMAKDLIPEERISLIFNGIDPGRFNARLREKLYVQKPYRVTLVPCTLDGLRQNFIQHVASTATAEHKVIFMGIDFGALFDRDNPNVRILPDHFAVENHIAQADRVAGILLGRVNLEAMMMNVASDIYDPITLTAEPWFTGYRQEYDIAHVAKKLLELLE